MNEKQIEIGDLFLQFLSNQGQASSDTYLEVFDDTNFNKLEIKVTINMLEEINLISSTGVYKYLSTEGIIAVKTGLSKYINEQIYEKRLDVKNKKTTIITNKITLILILISTIIAIGSYLNTLGVTNFHINSYPPKNMQHNQQQSQTNKHNAIEDYHIQYPIQDIYDSIVIKLSHDTLFINSVAKEIKATALKKD
ncbi:hypothetical protein E9993_14580 [Labilibacter sediminis]|nr:hypothetical protein E9993_14580 [Labilibacter sediminis]